MSILHGDCVEIMAGFPDEHFDLIIADPPYYRIARAEWDRQWSSIEEWAEWCGRWAAECCRVMKENGSFFAFGDEKQIAYMQVALDKIRWALINPITWQKPYYIKNTTSRATQRSYLNVGQERILFYAKDGPTGLQKILPKCLGASQLYLNGERIRAGVAIPDVCQHFGFATMCGHWFTDTTQPALPHADDYLELRRWWNEDYRNGGGSFLRREYEDLRREYEDSRRPFFGNGETDVWDGPITPKREKAHGAHPTQKPLWIIRKIIEHTTRPGALVLDPFLGSGTTAVACLDTGCNCIGIEQDEHYCEIAEARTKAWEEKHREQARQLALIV